MTLDNADQSNLVNKDLLRYIDLSSFQTIIQFDFNLYFTKGCMLDVLYFFPIFHHGNPQKDAEKLPVYSTHFNFALSF